MRALIRKVPVVYPLMRGGYYAGLYLLDKTVLRGKVNQWVWKIKTNKEFSDTWMSDPHRLYLADRIAGFEPVRSILEVGCNSGPNLAVLSARFPDARLSGTDINSRVVARAREAEKALSRSKTPWTVETGTAEELQRFPNRSVDIVMSDATLMYLGPRDIRAALAEFVRVADRAIVLHEWHDGQLNGGSKWWYAHWIHDYKTILESISGTEAVKVEPVPPGLWTDRGWNTWGATILVSVKAR